MKKGSNGSYTIDKQEVKSFGETGKEIRYNKEEKQEYILEEYNILKRILKEGKELSHYNQNQMRCLYYMI